MPPPSSPHRPWPQCDRDHAGPPRIGSRTGGSDEFSRPCPSYVRQDRMRRKDDAMTVATPTGGGGCARAGRGGRGWVGTWPSNTGGSSTCTATGCSASFDDAEDAGPGDDAAGLARASETYGSRSTFRAWLYGSHQRLPGPPSRHRRPTSLGRRRPGEMPSLEPCPGSGARQLPGPTTSGCRSGRAGDDRAGVHGGVQYLARAPAGGADDPGRDGLAGAETAELLEVRRWHSQQLAATRQGDDAGAPAGPSAVRSGRGRPTSPTRSARCSETASSMRTSVRRRHRLRSPPCCARTCRYCDAAVGGPARRP